MNDALITKLRNEAEDWRNTIGEMPLFDEAADALEKMQNAIAQAPHGDRCDSQWNPVSVFFGDCNCWKSKFNEPEVSSAP